MATVRFLDEQPAPVQGRVRWLDAEPAPSTQGFSFTDLPMAVMPGAPMLTMDQLLGRPEGLPDLPEIRSLGSEMMAEQGDTPSLAGAMRPGQAGNETQRRGAEFQRGLDLARDDAQRMDVVRNYFPDARFLQGPESSVLVDLGGRRYWLNRPGASMQDLGEIGTEMAISAGPGLAGAAVGTMVGGPIGGLVGLGLGLGGASVAQDRIVREYGSEQPVDWTRAAVAGGVGAALQGAGSLVARGIRRFFPAGRGLVQGGQLTQEGRTFFERLGIDPGSLTPERLRAFLDNTRQTDDLAAAARVAEAESLPAPVPLTRGQATQEPAQATIESNARQGLYGQEAGTVMNAARTGQEAALRQNMGALQEGFARGAPVIAPGQGARGAQERLVGMAEDAWQGIDQAYQGARELARTNRTVVDAGAVRTFAQGLRRTLGQDFDAATMPSLVRAIRGAETFAEAAGRQGRNVTQLNVTALVNLRTRLVNIARGAPGTPEAAATNRAIQELDGFLDDAITNGLIQGDEAVLQAFRDARALRAEYGRIFGQDDIVRKLVGQVQEGPRGGAGRLKVTPEDAVDYIFGRSTIGARNGMARDMAKLRDVLGADSAEWNALRQEAFLRLLRQQPAPGRGELSGQTFAKELDRAMREAPETMRILYSPEEIEAMQRFSRVFRLVTTLPSSGVRANPSGTAAAAAFADRAVSGLRFLGPAGQLALRSALRFVRDRDLAGQAGEWVRRALPPPASTLPPGAVGTVGGVLAPN